jgi:hypothetical protein
MLVPIKSTYDTLKFIIVCIFVISNVHISTRGTSSILSMIYALIIVGIKEDGVDDLFLTISLKEILENEETCLPTMPPCMRKTKKRVESLHML